MNECVCVCVHVHSFLEFVKRAKRVLSITAWGERQLHILLAFRLQQFFLFFFLKAFWPLTGFDGSGSGDHQNDSFIFAVMKMILLISFSHFLSCFRDFSNQLCFLCYVCFWWWF